MKQKDLTILITTYNRKNLIKNMLDQLFREKTKYSYKIILIDDCSKDPFYNTKNIQSLYPDLIYLRTLENNGRECFWVTINILMEKAKEIDSHFILQLSDDFELCNNFINTS